MPRVRVIGESYTLADRPKTYPKGSEIGVTDEEYRANKDLLEFISPTTDRVINAEGWSKDVVREDSVA